MTMPTGKKIKDTILCGNAGDNVYLTFKGGCRKELDEAMQGMECWQTMEHFKKCEKCQEEIAKYLEEEELSWRKQRDDEMTEMYSNNDCQRD